ncbi:MAG: hypothetical protein AB8E74_09585 [Prochlorococcus sp.]|nr:hypothetical protein [Prochlorococcaceae cyanobacterium Fu_MAG_50]
MVTDQLVRRNPESSQNRLFKSLGGVIEGELELSDPQHGWASTGMRLTPAHRKQRPDPSPQQQTMFIS